MRALQAVLSALFVPLRRLRLVWLLYLANLLFALVIAVPLFGVLERNLGHTVSGLRVQEGTGYLEQVWSDLRTTEKQPLSDLASGASALTVLWLLVSYTVLSGGTHFVLSQRGGPSSLARFLQGAGQLAGRFARLLPLHVLGLLGIYFLNRLLGDLLGRFVQDARHLQSSSAELGWLLQGKTLIVLLALGWLAVVSGLAKARAALDNERFMAGSFVKSLVTTLRHPVSTPLLAAIGPLLLAGVVLLYALARDHLPAEPLSLPFGEREFSIHPLTLYLVLSQLAVLLAQGVLVLWTAAIQRFHRLAHPLVETSPALDSLPPEPRPLTVVDRPLPRPGEKS